MQSLEIKTNQNVTIEYELGHLRDRILAFIIDFIILLTGIWLLTVIEEMMISGSARKYFEYLVMYPYIIFYSLASEILLGGTSIGKKALGIRIIRLDGKSNKISDYLIRWVFRGVDIYLSGGSLASILISSTDKKQRIGDVLANTVIVKTRSAYFNKLEDVLGIKSLDNYKPVYMQAGKLKENDVLLIKETLMRYKDYQNDAHEEAVKTLADSVSEILNTARPEEKKERDFLLTVMNDFIVLTR